jgi:hypothetical protein
MDEKFDDAETLLGDLSSAHGWPGVEPPRALHDALLQHTSRLVRRRSRIRRAKQLCALAAAYAAGLATMRAVWTEARPAPPAPQPSLVASSAAEKAPSAQAIAEESPGQLTSLTAAELRQRVPGAPREEQIRLLRLAGDRYLYAGDVAAALDCYRQVLELTPPDELGPPEANDSWLLADLKLSAAE